MAYGRICVRPLMKNTIWNEHGAQEVRTGIMNINIVEAAKHYEITGETYHEGI